MVARFHYDENIFREFLADKLGMREQTEVKEHLERCSDCQSKLEAIADAELCWDDVRRFLQPQDNLRSRDRGATSGHVAKIDFLDPSDYPNSVGRFSRYEIQGILGRGGMGVVLRGYDPALDRHSAIKVLAPELATSASARNRFSREAKSAAAVVHEHVIPIQTVDVERGLPYLVMPIVEGKSLEQRVAEAGPLELKEVLRIGMQIASGLAAAHAQGLVHRDVKPANILLENSVERVMITDFGLARAVDDANMTQSGIVTGTPQYMSPEQARGNDVDHRSDLFSLGSVLYFMCTGRSPFRAASTMGVLNRITNDKPRSLRMINPDVPVWLEDIVERLLEKDREKRFQSMTEVAELLGQWLAYVQQPHVVAKPAELTKQSMTSDCATPSRKRIRFMTTIVVALLSILLATVVVVLELNKGTLTIECADNSGIAVRIMKGGRIYERMTVTPNENSVRLQAGHYLVEVDGKSDGLKIEGGAVTVTRGNKHLVRIVHDESSGGNRKSSSRDSTDGEREALEPIDLGTYQLSPGDVLGLFIQGVMGQQGETPTPTPIRSPRISGLPPAFGSPIVVESDGHIRLPYIPSLKIAGMSLNQALGVLRNAYTVDNPIIQKGRDRILVTLVERGTPQRRTFLDHYKAQPGDVLGVFIPKVMGDAKEIEPIHFPADTRFPPAIGYPLVVSTEGEIQLPLIPPLKVEGLSLATLQEKIQRAYTVDYKVVQTTFVRVSVMQLGNIEAGVPESVESNTVTEERKSASADPSVDVRQISLTNLKQIGIAFRNYHDTYQMFPAAVQIGPKNIPHSWRVSILPFVEGLKLYEKYRQDEPWDSEHNKKLLAEMPDVYRSPRDAATSTKTSYFGFALPSNSKQQPEKSPYAPALAGNRGIRLADIEDGTSNCILVVESKLDVPWTKPDDIPFDEALPMPVIGGIHERGFYALMCDGFVGLFPDSYDPAMLKKIIGRHDGNAVKLPWKPH